MRALQGQTGTAPPDDSSAVAVHPAVMQSGTASPVDLYVRPAEEAVFTLHAEAGTLLPDAFHADLADQGLTRVFVRKRDRRLYWHYVENHVAAIVEAGIVPRREACELVYGASRRAMDEVFRDPRARGNVGRAYGLVEAVVASVLRDSEALWQMVGAAPARFRTYAHSVNVAMFLVAACHGILGIADPRVLKRIGMGAIFHDIGKSELPAYLLAVPMERMSREEGIAFREHPMLGLDILRGQGRVTPTSEAIIRWHHERADGAGYPDGLAGERLPAVVRLACIVNVFDFLITERPFGEAKPPFEALRTMLGAMPGRFAPDLVMKFAQFLGPTRTALNARFRPVGGAGNVH
jgi:putative nucleotidyltransferase with HDIG domain